MHCWDCRRVSEFWIRVKYPKLALQAINESIKTDLSKQLSGSGCRRMECGVQSAGRGGATEAGLSYQLDAHVAHEKWPALWSCCRAAVACHVSQCLSALAAERALNYVHLYSFFYCRGLIPNYCANYFKFYPQLSPVMDNVNFGNSPCACVCVSCMCVCH